ncbi:MAG: zinc ribbon domain-containing protein [Bacillota bacterium]|jgi:putative FmdB family regulatory protein|nr:zinc ribbon domain-containing protein [Bacillota bacterium]
MPIFDYKCNGCGRTFDTLVRSSSETVECPDCGSTDVTKLVSKFGFKSGSAFSSSAGSACGSCSGGSCSSCGH